MNENQQNFESLRRLLALKRHEVPPPGYFNNFSRQVIARIRAGEVEDSATRWERLFVGMPWLLKWLQGIETKPVFAGGFATALCLLLLFGAVMAQRPESVAQAFLQPTRETAPFATTIATATPMPPTALEQPVNQIMIADNSTNPVINFASAPMGQIPNPQFLTFPVSGN
jgi:hypothetical protein